MASENQAKQNPNTLVLDKPAKTRRIPVKSGASIKITKRKRKFLFSC